MKPISLAFPFLLALFVAACDKEPSPAPSEAAAPTTEPTPPSSSPGTHVDHPPVGAGKGKPIVVTANQSISGSFASGSDGRITAVGVRIGNYRGAADGSLALRLCVEDTCQDARMPLTGSRDNDYLVFQLPAPATVARKQVVDYTLTRSGDATNRVAVWAYPSIGGQQGLIDPAGTRTGLLPRLAIHFGE